LFIPARMTDPINLWIVTFSAWWRHQVAECTINSYPMISRCTNEQRWCRTILGKGMGESGPSCFRKSLVALFHRWWNLTADKIPG
jgi:hypothetical protein